MGQRAQPSGCYFPARLTLNSGDCLGMVAVISISHIGVMRKSRRHREPTQCLANSRCLNQVLLLLLGALKEEGVLEERGQGHLEVRMQVHSVSMFACACMPACVHAWKAQAPSATDACLAWE